MLHDLEELFGLDVVRGELLVVQGVVVKYDTKQFPGIKRLTLSHRFVLALRVTMHVLAFLLAIKYFDQVLFQLSTLQLAHHLVLRGEHSSMPLLYIDFLTLHDIRLLS